MLIEARVLIAEKQLDGLEKILMTGKGSLISPGNWNVTCGLIAQLRLQIPAIWNPSLGVVSDTPDGMKLPIIEA